MTNQTTSIDYEHPYASLTWEHQPTGGGWQDATNLSGYVSGQGTKTLELSGADVLEVGLLRCAVANPEGVIQHTDTAQLIADPVSPVFIVGITNQLPYEGETATYGPVTVSGNPVPTLHWEAEIASGSGTWDNADNIYGADGSGQGTSAYAIANATPADSRGVRVTATNSEGEHISQAALTVTPKLEFTTHPNNETITATP